jgi:hypothetical protein
MHILHYSLSDRTRPISVLADSGSEVTIASLSFLEELSSQGFCTIYSLITPISVCSPLGCCLNCYKTTKIRILSPFFSDPTEIEIFAVENSASSMMTTYVILSYTDSITLGFLPEYETTNRASNSGTVGGVVSSATLLNSPLPFRNPAVHNCGPDILHTPTTTSTHISELLSQEIDPLAYEDFLEDDDDLPNFTPTGVPFEQNIHLESVEDSFKEKILELCRKYPDILSDIVDKDPALFDTPMEIEVDEVKWHTLAGNQKGPRIQSKEKGMKHINRFN